MNWLISKASNRKGQGTVEYALVTLAIVIIIGIVLLAVDSPLRAAIVGVFQKIVDNVNG